MGGEARGSLQWLGNSEKRDRTRGFVAPSEAHPPNFFEVRHSPLGDWPDLSLLHLYATCIIRSLSCSFLTYLHPTPRPLPLPSALLTHSPSPPYLRLLQPHCG